MCLKAEDSKLEYCVCYVYKFRMAEIVYRASPTATVSLDLLITQNFPWQLTSAWLARVMVQQFYFYSRSITNSQHLCHQVKHKAKEGLPCPIDIKCFLHCL